MNAEQNYVKINRESWNNRTESHLKSDFYDLKGFLKGKSSLNEIELSLLGNIEGKSILHLQCHFGQDSISLSRMGADVTGIDLANKAIESAVEIAKQTNAETQFICCELYELPKYLDKEFDIIYTSYGTIGWLPDLNKWAEIIAKFLKANGLFIFIEFHPFVWMYNDDFDEIKYRYFNSGAITETESGTYADKQAAISQSYVMWNHSLSEVLGSLLKNNLEIISFNEYDYSPYDCFNKTIKIAERKYRIEHMDNKIPMTYSLVAKKKS